MADEKHPHSKLEDTEFLIACAINEYQKAHHLSNKEVRERFNSHFVWEKMLAQHEYLHQISMQEVCEYVEEIMQETEKDLFLYHGTTAIFEIIDLKKSHNRRDFGKGFYTTVLREQARQWGQRLSLRQRSNHSKYYIYEYSFQGIEELSVLRFDTMNLEWLEFIKENRKNGGTQHSYDIVIGPVADDRTSETIQLYVMGVYTAEEALRRLTYSNVNNQVSFHTQKALACLSLIRRVDYE